MKRHPRIGDALEGAALRLPVADIGERHDERAARVFGLLSQKRNLPGMGKGQRTKQHRIEDAEHGSVDADSQCESQNGGEGEAGTAKKLAQGVAHTGKTEGSQSVIPAAAFWRR